jgi:hypothetical protein
MGADGQKETLGSSMKQKIDPLNANEAAWIKTQLENASMFIQGFSPHDWEQPLTLAALDRAYAAFPQNQAIQTRSTR